MRSGPATQTAFVRGFLLALSPHGGGTTASARQRITIDQVNKDAPPLPKPFADSRSCDHQPATAAAATGLVHAPGS